MGIDNTKSMFLYLHYLITVITLLREIKKCKIESRI